MSQHMQDGDELVLLHLPSINRGTYEGGRDKQSGYLHRHSNRLLTPRERLICEVYVMDEGHDNPAFITNGDVDPSSYEKSNGTVHPPSAKEPSKDPQQPEDDEYEEGPCGWGSWTPRWMQCCNNPKGYLVMYSFLAIMQGTLVNGLVNVIISTIEKRYDLNSSLTGLIAASYDIAFCILSLFVSFYGQRGHKPRWLAFSAFMIGLGAVVFSLPHFAIGKYEYGSKYNEICLSPETNSTLIPCTNNKQSSLSNFLYVFMLGQLLMGVGGTPLYTLGTAFFDDSLPTHKSSLYIGISQGMSVLGPAIGYVIGGQLLDIYIDLDKGIRAEMTTDDQRWLGAWWIGFFICGGVTWLLIAPFSCFPKHLPGTAKIQSQRISEAHNDGSQNIVDEKNLGKSFKDFPISLWLMLKNPVLLSLTFASCADALITTGFAAFLPKFIENQFSLTASFSAILGGGALIPAAAIGQIIGGLIISKFKIGCKNSILFSIIMSFISVALMTVFIFAKCNNDPFAGVSTLYNGTGEIGEISAPCNSNCSCDRSFFDPVCGSDGVQYFSSCYAGCDTAHEGSNKVYSNCSCIGNQVRKVQQNETFLNITHVIHGKCETSCNNLILFMVFFFCVVVTTFMIATPLTMSIIRCVPDKQRSFALGVQWLFIRLLGSIPGPISFGALIDSSCLLWNVNECGRKGACWTYDNPDTSMKLIYISAASKATTIIFLFVAYFIYKPPPSKTEEHRESDNVVSSSSL
uniref:Solute carrier organic anion transporter family member n=1 Tax=Leptobrachium leishanense TaxID=445787 RepID=A0A8C5M0G3_9ANUR